MSDRSPDSFQQITDVLSRSLKQAFNEVCPKRYGGSLSLRRMTSSPEDPGVSFRIEGPEAVDLQIHVGVSHVGGNVYDISTQLEDGSPHQFTYSEPDHSGSSLSLAPYLGKKIARHLLDEVEQRLGQEMLRQQVLADE